MGTLSTSLRPLTPRTPISLGEGLRGSVVIGSHGIFRARRRFRTCSMPFCPLRMVRAWRIS
jgi:hypothetical protein